MLTVLSTRIIFPKCKCRIIELSWTGRADSLFEGLLSFILHSKWLGRRSKNGMIMRSHSDGSLPNKRQKIFALDESNLGSKFFSFLNEKRKMSAF